MANEPGATDAWLVFATWAAMMPAMMLPGALPAILRAGRGATRSRFAFGAGYLGLWAAFGAAAAALQLALDAAGLLSGDMALRDSVAAGISLVAIAAYQLTPMKRACLRRCSVAQSSGVRYALACLGCSAPLMGVLFVVGTMSYAWMIVLAAWIAAEKMLRAGERLAPLAAAGLAGWGALVLLL